ncbi:heptaprenylglyceryl phosphate synthase [Candidatus Nanohalovita haloferacivicina]|uniref:heptaprenylglyceryl phosphate synthase n=1 Tax=Candidatus Nanohalovita haloferacivicina TaxID=2978046 RepID=UPI00325FB269|nr:Geranylgeranylglyceryl phosphate synthase [Candidatus Nanohalobia archaeon BNXNv]
MNKGQEFWELVKKSTGFGPNWDNINHITKIDPEKGLSSSDLEYLEGTDAVMVGGSDGVTAENTAEVLELLDDTDIPVILEPYSGEHVVGGNGKTNNFSASDYTAVASVWNGNEENFKGKHEQFFGSELPAVKQELYNEIESMVGDGLTGRAAKNIAGRGLDNKLLREAYIVQNPESAVAELTEATEPVDSETVGQIAGAVENFFDNFDILYIEYSGMYGDPEDVEAAAEMLEDTTLLYGGGISSEDQALEMLDSGADTVVVGDSFHEDPEEYRDTQV